MIEETGVVAELKGRHAWVETERRSSCGSCSAKGCGTGVLAKVVGARRQRVRVENTIGAEAGDTIVLGLREDALLRGSLAVYIVPLLAMLAAAFFGEALAPQWGATDSEAWAATAGLLGFGGGLLWLRGFGRRAASQERYQAVAVRVTAKAGITHVNFDKLAKR